jgi:hypothetical protein
MSFEMLVKKSNVLISWMWKWVERLKKLVNKNSIKH